MSKKLYPVPMKYTAESPVRQSPSFMERLRTAITIGNERSFDNGMKPVKVRLINGWQDLTSDRLNILVCNFLYDREAAHYRILRELEHATGIRRERIVYVTFLVIFALLIYQNALTILHSLIVLIFPAACTLMLLSTEDVANAQFWLRYWTVYALVTVFSRILLKRTNHENGDVSWLELIFFMICLIPGTFLLDFVFTFIMPFFNAMKAKIEEYNFQLACYLN
ncbi:unnamed protein product [Cylicocyclus nassatus]|uniref:Uncharacterized protein n=1 Tax=Cylicocyclus nassatus TaxID=53992 RepID=A0AA36GUY3_CYLNA|nr:unnamed protein product [Cylicocyclus nassatus]